MGQLAEQGGYHGSDDPPELDEGLFEESGEALTLIDSLGEAWVFHILPDDTGRSAVWAAQRLADDEMTVVANKFTIRALDLSRPDWFLASSNVVEVAVRNGLWQSNSTAPFDFAAVYAPDALDPPGWSDRRTWHLFNRGHTSTPRPTCNSTALPSVAHLLSSPVLCCAALSQPRGHLRT